MSRDKKITNECYNVDEIICHNLVCSQNFIISYFVFIYYLLALTAFVEMSMGSSISCQVDLIDKDGGLDYIKLGLGLSNCSCKSNSSTTLLR